MNFLVSRLERPNPVHLQTNAVWHGTLYHFFRRDGIDLEKSLEGLARSLLCQLLWPFRNFLKTLLKSFRQKSFGVNLTKEKVIWGTEKLLKLLEVSIQEVLAVTDVRIFIDGVDECDKEGAKQFLKMFQDVTRRHAEEDTGTATYQLINHADIRRYVERAFHGPDLSLSQDDAQILIDRIDMNANGIFVWAELIVDQMLEDIKQRMPITQVIAKSGKLPTKLIDLYREIIVRIGEEHASQSLRLLQWVCFWKVPSRELKSTSTEYDVIHKVPTQFSLGSLRAFMNFQAYLEASTAGEESYLFTDISNDDMMEYQIKKLSGGLARSADGVELVHLSVKDFMLTEGFTILGSRTSSSTLIIGQVHSRLAEACVGYLSTFTQDHSVSTMNSSAMAEARSEAFSPVPEPLREPVKYALNHAFAHASRADKELHDGKFSQTFTSLLHPLLGRQAAWVALLRQEMPDLLSRIFDFTQDHIPDEAHMHDGKGIFSLLAALYRMPRVLEELIPAELQSLRDEAIYARTYRKMLSRLLIMAVKKGFVEVVGQLARADVCVLTSMRPSHWENPLLIAALNNDFPVVQLLVARGYPVHESLLCTIISRSTTYDMCQYFLAKGAKLGNELYSPLKAAVDASNVELVKLFLRQGANINAKASRNNGYDGILLSPLEAAINGQCDYDVVKTLLEGEADVGAARTDGHSYIYHYTLDCIQQVRATDGTRERRWADFTMERMEGKELSDMIEIFVRKRQDVLPLLESYPPRSARSTRERFRDADLPSRKIIQQQDREAAHQPTQRNVGQPDPEDVVQRRRKGPNFNEMLRSCFPARKSTKG